MSIQPLAAIHNKPYIIIIIIRWTDGRQLTSIARRLLKYGRLKSAKRVQRLEQDFAF